MRNGAARRIARRQTMLQALRHEMGDDLRVGLRGEDVAVGSQLLAQFAEILDDAVVDDGDIAGKMRMGIGLVRHAMRSPAGVADADGARQRFVAQAVFQIDELALGAAAVERAPSTVAMPAES